MFHFRVNFQTHFSSPPFRDTQMYKGPLVKAMKKGHPTHKGKWVILEDNDPTGYKSSLGERAKTDAGIEAMELPKRSPDFNVLDYHIWHAVNTRMRKQEASFTGRKKETKGQYLARLRKTALGLPTAEVTRAVRSMKKRVQLLKAADGGLIEE